MNCIDFIKARYPKKRFSQYEYTGLKDFLGCRIYNGAILKVHSLDFCVYYRVEKKEYNNHIYFINKNCVLHYEDFLDTFDVSKDEHIKVEVLGYYDNIKEVKDKEFNFFVSEEI